MFLQGHGHASTENDNGGAAVKKLPVLHSSGSLKYVKKCVYIISSCFPTSIFNFSILNFQLTLAG